MKDAFFKLPFMGRVFLGTGLPFGLVMGAVFFMQGLLGSAGVMGAATIGGFGGLFAGLFFGMAMAITLGLMQAYGTRGADQDANAPVHATTTLFLDLSVDECLQLAESALESLGVAVTTIDGPEGGGRQAKTGFSLKSFGETVLMTATRLDGKTALLISSKPVIPTTIVDYGANAHNVRTLSAKVLELAGSPDQDVPVQEAQRLEAELKQMRQAQRVGE